MSALLYLGALLASNFASTGHRRPFVLQTSMWLPEEHRQPSFATKLQRLVLPGAPAGTKLSMQDAKQSRSWGQTRWYLCEALSWLINHSAHPSRFNT